MHNWWCLSLLIACCNKLTSLPICDQAILLLEKGDVSRARLLTQSLSTDDEERRCAKRWQQAFGSWLDGDHSTSFSAIRQSMRNHTKELESLPPLATENCWREEEKAAEKASLTPVFGGLALGTEEARQRRGWDACCRRASEGANDPACFQWPEERERCCAMGIENSNYLFIPAIRELFLRVQLMNDRVLDIAQDGFLRPFDPASILWPAGYLLAQWVTDTRVCHRLRRKRVLDLGTGVGLVALAAASCGATVVATDKEPHSLALTLENAERNGLGHLITVSQLDWTSDSAVQLLTHSQGPFDLVLGAALLFEGWIGRLWHVLAVLAAPVALSSASSASSPSSPSSPSQAPAAMVALSHTTNVLQPPTNHGQNSSEQNSVSFAVSSFERVPGTDYNMLTRTQREEDGSDFDVLVLEWSVSIGASGSDGAESASANDKSEL